MCSYLIFGGYSQWFGYLQRIVGDCVNSFDPVPLSIYTQRVTQLDCIFLFLELRLSTLSCVSRLLKEQKHFEGSCPILSHYCLA